MCTPTLQMYTEKNHGALYVRYHKPPHLKHLEFLLMAYSITVFLIINLSSHVLEIIYQRHPCYVNIKQSKEILKLKVVPQPLFSDLKFVSHEPLVLFRLAKEVDYYEIIQCVGLYISQ